MHVHDFVHAYVSTTYQKSIPSVFWYTMLVYDCYGSIISALLHIMCIHGIWKWSTDSQWGEILLEYRGFNLSSKFLNSRVFFQRFPSFERTRQYFQRFDRNHYFYRFYEIFMKYSFNDSNMKTEEVFRERLVQKDHNASLEIISLHFVRTQLDFCMNHVFPTIGACHLCITMPQSFCWWSITWVKM